MALPHSYITDVLYHGGDPSMYVSRGCLHPHVFNVVDSFGINKPLVLDCGHCYRCQDQIREEWATRMLLHSTSTPGCTPNPWCRAYFVTLTYGTYDLNGLCSHPFYDDWMSSFPMMDAHNQNNSYAWGPSVLYRPHIQKYIKRLKKSLADITPISYVYCGEFGSTYGRPHWHLIIWTYKDIDTTFFKSAWGYQMPTGTFSIGDVQVDDLYNNGTFSECVKLDNHMHDAKFCFSYLAKYLHKQEEDSFPPDALRRLYHAFGQLDLDPLHDITPDASAYAANSRIFTYNGKTYENLTFNDFRKLVGPCFASSTSVGIGRKYWLDNCARFEKGNFTLPKWRGKTLHFPRYYSHLLSLKKCPFRFEKAVLSGRTYTKDNYEAVFDYFSMLAEDPYSISSSYTSKVVAFTGAEYAIHPEFTNYDFVVLKSPTGIFKGVLNTSTNHFDFYQFDKSLREYHKCFSYRLEEFCEIVMNTILLQYEHTLDALKILHEKFVFHELTFDNDDCKNAIDTFISLRDQKQKAYVASHKFLPV